MTTDTAFTATRRTRIADLPRLDSLDRAYQEDPHRFHRQARELGQVAIGPFGPVALSYDAVRTVLRDRRFRRPKDLGLEAQGITSGLLWDRAATGLLSLDGEDHHRLRKLVSRAFNPDCAAR